MERNRQGDRNASGGHQQGGRSMQRRDAAQSQQGGGKQQRGQHVQQSFGAEQFQTMAEAAMRGTAMLWDLQLATARNLWRTQARTAALLGIPDYSELFDVGDERARRLFSTSAEQVLTSVRQARETVVLVQREFGRIAEQQTIGITEEVRERIDDLGRYTEQGLNELQQLATGHGGALSREEEAEDARPGESGPEPASRAAEANVVGGVEPPEPAGVEPLEPAGARAGLALRDEASRDMREALPPPPQRETGPAPRTKRAQKARPKGRRKR
jgi:hypothetical protein